MKATGIVRRIDDLGRVVIPKEIRRTMRIREGDPLEIFTDKDGELIFKKYSPHRRAFRLCGTDMREPEKIDRLHSGCVRQRQRYRHLRRRQERAA